MHDQRALTRVEQQVFSAPRYLADTQATQFLSQIEGYRPAQAPDFLSWRWRCDSLDVG